MRRKGTWKHHPSPSPPTACRARSSWVWLLLQAPNDFSFFSPHCKDPPRALKLGWKCTFPCHSAAGLEGPWWTPQDTIRAFKSLSSSPGRPGTSIVPLKTSCRDPVPSKSWPGSRCEGPGVHLETRFQEPYLVFPNMNPKGYPDLQSVVQVIDRHANSGEKPSSPDLPDFKVDRTTGDKTQDREQEMSCQCSKNELVNKQRMHRDSFPLNLFLRRRSYLHDFLETTFGILKLQKVIYCFPNVGKDGVGLNCPYLATWRWFIISN